MQIGNGRYPLGTTPAFRRGGGAKKTRTRAPAFRPEQSPHAAEPRRPLRGGKQRLLEWAGGRHGLIGSGSTALGAPKFEIDRQRAVRVTPASADLTQPVGCNRIATYASNVAAVGHRGTPGGVPSQRRRARSRPGPARVQAGRGDGRGRRGPCGAAPRSDGASRTRGCSPPASRLLQTTAWPGRAAIRFASSSA
jgi:hypothetical protein